MFVKYFLYLLMIPAPKNCIQGRPFAKSGPYREAFISEEYKRKEFTAKCKEKKTSSVETINCLFGMAMRDYSIRRGQEMKYFYAIFAFATRMMSPNSIEQGNYMAFPLIKIDCELNFE